MPWLRFNALGVSRHTQDTYTHTRVVVAAVLIVMPVVQPAVVVVVVYHVAAVVVAVAVVSCVLKSGKLTMSQSAINNFTTFSPVIRLNVHKTRTRQGAARVARTTGRGVWRRRRERNKSNNYKTNRIQCARIASGKRRRGYKKCEKRNPSVCPHAC